MSTEEGRRRLEGAHTPPSGARATILGGVGRPMSSRGIGPLRRSRRGPIEHARGSDPREPLDRDPEPYCRMVNRRASVRLTVKLDCGSRDQYWARTVTPAVRAGSLPESIRALKS